MEDVVSWVYDAAGSVGFLYDVEDGVLILV